MSASDRNGTTSGTRSEIRFASDDELHALVRAFEGGDLGERGFGHQSHIAVAACYIAETGADEALLRMRRGLHRLLATQGHGPAEIAAHYHETITVFWVRLLAHLLAAGEAGEPLHRRVNRILDRWGTSAPLYAHYRRATVHSAEARRSWVPPDRKPLPD